MGDYRTTTGEPLPTGRMERLRTRRVWIRRGGLMVGLMVVAGFLVPVRVRIAANGYVTSDHYAEVRPATVGPVAEIQRQSGDRVEAGTILALLDDREERAALEAARSAVRSMEARVALRRSELEQEERQRALRITQAGYRVSHAEQDLALTEELYGQGLVSGRVREERRMALALAQTDLALVRDEDETLARKSLAVLEAEKAVIESEVLRAEARLAARHIPAPIAGELVRYEFVPGELVTPEHVLYEVFGGERQILKLRIPERHATRVLPGAPYKARLRTARGWRDGAFRGTVEGLRSIIQVDSQQAYRMAYCTFDAGGRPVPPGASAEARITVARVPFWFWLLGIR